MLILTSTVVEDVQVVIIADAVERFGGFLLWLEPYDDKNNKISVKKPLDRIREIMMKQVMIPTRNEREFCGLPIGTYAFQVSNLCEA